MGVAKKTEGLAILEDGHCLQMDHSKITGGVVTDGDVEEMGFTLDIFSAKQRSAGMKSYLCSSYTDLVCPLWEAIYSSIQANIWA